MGCAAGFTLVEMMIAVAIIAILLALGMPAFQSIIHNAQIHSAAESVQAGLHLARTEALRRNARVSFWMVNGLSAACVRSNVGTSWVVSQDDPAGKCNLASSETVDPRLIQSRAGGDGSPSVNVTALDGAVAPAAASCVTFNGFGRVEATCVDGSNPIADMSFVSAVAPATTRALRVIVAPGGSVRLCDSTVTSNTDPRFCQ